MIEIVDIPKMKLSDVKWEDVMYDVRCEIVKFVDESAVTDIIEFPYIPLVVVRDFILNVYDTGADFELGVCDHCDNIDMRCHFDTNNRTFSAIGDGYYGGVKLKRLK